MLPCLRKYKGIIYMQKIKKKLGNNHKTWYNLGKNPFGIRSYLGNDTFGKLSVWEIIIWEKIHLEKISYCRLSSPDLLWLIMSVCLSPFGRP